ncbi:PREDICTED: G-protein coupled receptor GRL101-like [Priapulus caudatus]|uniref:G-protein coupled receptor GRL101-like n=1 Tax=Priapulus caudatus TaxID=37621 RepID=A0ABM1DVS9_PRICU|nr:PREDICTED: G-protein coupled receptor GRL101-like [Priapulus caudatus]
MNSSVVGGDIVLGSKCPPDSFTCQNGDCTSLSRYCDFVEDCQDGSDEVNCVHRNCSESEFNCNNGQCVPRDKVCDLTPDCSDGSDEEGCAGRCKPQETFQCFDSTCIPAHAFCDGYVDCAGEYAEDEPENCESITTDVLAIKERKQLCDAGYLSCSDVYNSRKHVPSGTYTIDIDGSAGDVDPFPVNCDFQRQDDDSVTAWTLIHHDSEERTYVRSHVIGPGGHRRNVSYVGITAIQLEALIADADSCRQFVRWECEGAAFGFDDRAVSWWISRDLQPQYYWGGATRNHTCGCYPNCTQPELACNCDVNQRFLWQEDSGYLTDKTKLPVMQLWLGGTSGTGEAGYITLGPLECTSALAESHRKDCLTSINWLQCHNGHYVNDALACLDGYDEDGFQTGCRDVSHLRNCEYFQCPDNYVKCPGSYCVPMHTVCDGQWDCPGGHDEVNCETFSCPGMYKCHQQQYCIPAAQLCDGRRQCEMGDDEYLCDIQCPLPCRCSALSIFCSYSNLTELPDKIPFQIRKLDISHNLIDLDSIEFGNWLYLSELNISFNSIHNVPSSRFQMLHNLYLLDLRYNNIQHIEENAFAGLQNLRYLLLTGNFNLSDIDSNAFEGLGLLNELVLVGHSLSTLKSGTFLGLEQLKHLNLSGNKLTEVHDGAFDGLTQLQLLDVRGNDINVFSEAMFTGLENLEYLYSDSFKFCCLAKGLVSFDNCLPQADAFSSCEDLMSNYTLRISIWVLGTIAFACNLFVIIWRLKTKDANRISSGLVLSLGCADLLMGVYLLIIAGVDMHYRGRYIAYAESWRNSTLCKFAGFLSTLSSEVAVLTLTLITIDRLICLAFQFRVRRFTVKQMYIMLGTAWMAATVLSCIPFLIDSYFHGQFYSKSGTCLALPLTAEVHPGWEYSVALFLCLNFIAFVVIIVSYVYMYVTITKTTRAVQRISSQKSKELSVGRQMALLVLSNFCCWAPIIIMGLLALGGAVVIPGAVYAWTAVFILPFNAATDPILYTISSLDLRTVRYGLSWKNSNNKSRYHSNAANGASVYDRQSKINNYSVPVNDGGDLAKSLRKKPTFNHKAPHGYISLTQFLKESRPIRIDDVRYITKVICETLNQVHKSGYALGHFESETIFISRNVADQIHVYVPDLNAYKTGVYPTQKHSDDTAQDMEDLANIVKRMLRAYKLQSRYNSECNVSHV